MILAILFAENIELSVIRKYNIKNNTVIINALLS